LCNPYIADPLVRLLFAQMVVTNILQLKRIFEHTFNFLIVITHCIESNESLPSCIVKVTGLQPGT
jgi:hypothetical protein